MASSIHPDYPIRRLPRRSRIQAASDPYAWERSVRRNVQRGTGAPVLLGRMSWKGHGASPARREERKKLQEARVARNRAKRIQRKANFDAQREQEKIDYWDQADFATRRDRTSPRAKAARRRGATVAQIDANSRERQRQAIERRRQAIALQNLKNREKVWELLPPGKETIAWDSLSPEEQDKIIEEFNV